MSTVSFGMSNPPEAGGQPGVYEERRAQWFLEHSFFPDFVNRNPRGKKKGTEIAGALVLFDDFAVLVKVKAQCGEHTPYQGRQRNCRKHSNSCGRRTKNSPLVASLSTSMR
ncbi:MAG TPA: hypothetical protein VM120_09565, partial [Bryobacteraceae bacterium]|nr:hypothetical protein [Bryobacteraceae bacterium]